MHEEVAMDDINRAIAELNRAIGALQSIAATNTMILQDIKGDLHRHFDDDKKEFSLIDARLGGIEKKVYWFSGVTAAVAFIAAKLTGKF